MTMPFTAGFVLQPGQLSLQRAREESLLRKEFLCIW
jgi:hypothetical protein